MDMNLKISRSGNRLTKVQKSIDFFKMSLKKRTKILTNDWKPLFKLWTELKKEQKQKLKIKAKEKAKRDQQK